MWVQYDGVLNPLPEESTIQKFKSFFYNYYERKMEKNILTAAKYFFPKWRHFSVNGSESTSVDVIKNVDMLCEGLMKNVMLCCKKWKWGGEENCRAFLGKVLFVYTIMLQKLIQILVLKYMIKFRNFFLPDDNCILDFSVHISIIKD